jgi:NAD(P)-dependent dehydrogenase (short-subunit alcohol dehydrogenase family)
MKDVSERVALITGGSSGIGLGIARSFVNAGMRVAITYQTTWHLDHAMSFFSGAADRVHAIRVDVTDRAQMENAASETVRAFGRIHVLINSAGAIMIKRFSEMTYEDWDRLLAVNLTGAFNSIKAVLPYIQSHGEGGHIVTISSIFGLFAAGPNQSAYCVSKFATVGLTEALRAELAGSNIGTSVCCPGLVRSNIFDAADESDMSPDERQRGIDIMSSAIPADPMDIGGVVLQGMLNDDLYIITHPETRPFIEARHEMLMAAVSRGLPSSDHKDAQVRSALPNSIYAAKS